MKQTIFTLFILLCTLSLYAQDESADLTDTKAPAFELTDINGNSISSNATEGKVVVLNFWFIGCKPCLEEIPELNEVYEKYEKNPDVVFVSITFDEAKKVKKKLDKYNIKYPIVADGQEACELFEVAGYPTNMVIDKAGNVSFTFSGGFSGIGKLLSKSIQKALGM